MKLFLTLIIFTILIFTNKFTAQWVELNSGVTVRLNSLNSIKGITTWACGTNGTVIKSSNMGDSWVNANQFGISQNVTLNSIYCFNDLESIICGKDGNNAEVYRTYDGGNSWDAVLVQNGGSFNAFHFIDENTGILIGSPVGGKWSIWKTHDGGFSWTESHSELTQNNNEQGFFNSLWATGNKIWFGTDNYRIYNTTNFGDSWRVLSTGTEKNITSLWFDFDYNIGFTGSQNFIKTINSGHNWFSESLPGSGNIIGVTGSAHSRFNWAVRSDNKIYLNPHNSNVWQYDYTAPNGNYTYITIERGGYFSGAVFALRDNGGISRTYFLPLAINTISTEIPSSFNLYQNYPNPFNPETNIRFDVSRSENVNINIFDAAGRSVEELVNENLTPGKYEVSWNAAKYSSGIFFCKLAAAENTKIIKLVLVK